MMQEKSYINATSQEKTMLLLLSTGAGPTSASGLLPTQVANVCSH